MKTRKLLTITSAIAAVLLVGVLGLHAGPVAVSVNFTGNDGGGINNSRTTSLTNVVMDPTGATVETAGAPGFATTNWNNFDRYGDVGSGIIDYTGADSGLHMQWNANWCRSSGAYSTLHTPDSKLMDGQNDSDWSGGPPSTWTAGSLYGEDYANNPAEYVGGIQAWMAAKGAISYKVVLYVQGYHAWGQISEYFIQAVTGNPSSWGMSVVGNLTPSLFCNETGPFSGSYSQVPATCTNGASASSGCNYMVFAGLTNDAILIRGACAGLGGNNQTATTFGFQIVAEFPAALSVGAPAASGAISVAQAITNTLSATASGGTGPYKYQWLTDSGSGGAFTPITSATNSTLAVNMTGMTPGVAYSYSLVATDSVLATATSAPIALNIIKVLPGTLAGNGNVTPTPNSADISQLNEAGGYQSSDGLNYYTDNGNNNNQYCGQTFTTGTNALGYTLTSLAIGLEGGGNGGQSAGTIYDLFIYQISTNGQVGNLIVDVTNLMGSTFAYPEWAVWNFAGITLTNNAVYGYGFSRRSTGGYLGMATSPGWYQAYSGGQIAAFHRDGGAVLYGSSGYGTSQNDGVFDIGLIANTPGIILNPPTASPNPAYALSPVQLMDTVFAGTPTSYKWLTGDGSGGYILVSGATSTNLTVYPLNFNPGGADYVTNYYMVATDASANSVTSSAIALTIHAATVPLITGPTPASVVTFVGDSRSYTVTENGTIPITNQWQFNNGGGYVSLTGQTNTTLALSNLQATNSGNYQMLAANVVGSASNSVTLTVNPAPAAPVASNQLYYNAVYTNHPWAYWRLNETNDPTAVGAPLYTAYDYSGHGFDSIYGTNVTVGYAGPQPPTYPNMDANELAVDTLSATPGAWLTPPALNLTGNSNVTFMTWIYPAGTVGTYTGLLMNRGGADGACGFGFGGTTDHLGYTWNNNSYSTYSWDSGLAVAENQWNFVAYVITPTNAVVYLGNLVGGTNFLVSTHTLNHIPQTFAGGTVRLGGDPAGVGNTFNGLITEASLFTNALTASQVQQYFLIAIGAQALAPTVPNVTVTPAAAAGAGVYSGQNVRLSSIPTGTAPLSLQWQAGPDGSTWTNVPNATNTDLLINPLMVGVIHYQLLVTNAAGAVSTTPVTITFNALPAYPAGLWTANFQETNNIGSGHTAGGGVGHYVGRGILGNGSYWNILPHVLAAGHEYDAGQINSVSDLKDDGVTSSGISCQMNNGGSYNSLGTSLPNSSDLGNLLDQFYRTYYSPGALKFFGVPDGTYNLTCYAGNGVDGNLGSTFVVHDSHNGDQTNSTAEATHTTDALAESVNFVTFTNVHVIGGTLTVDVFANTNNGGNPTIEGAQVQLVSYDPPVAAFTGTPTNGATPLTVTFANNSTGSTNWHWDFGDGNTFNTAGNTNVSHIYAAVGSYTVSLTAVGPLGTNSTTNTAYIVVANPVSSDASLSYLALSPLGALTPTFNTTLTNYTATNANANTSVTVTVTNTSAFATNVLFLNGTPQATNAGSLTASVPLVVGSGNAIVVVVTAQDGTTTRTNTVDVTRLPSSNAGLTSLALTPAGTLYPTFATGTLSYNATNTCSGNPLTVTVTNADVTAANTLYLNGVSQGLLTNGVASAPLTLATGANTVTVQVVSQDLTATNDYVVAAMLTAPPTVGVNSVTNCGAVATLLTASTSAGSPAYSWSPGGATTASITVTPSSTTIYTVTVTDGTTGCANSGSGTITVNPVPTVSVNSTNIYAGGTATLTATTSASSPSYLWSPGAETTASITVSPSTNTTYTVTVTDGTTGCANSGSGTVTILPSTNALLASLTITPAGTLAPTFASGTTSYNATNTYANKTVAVAATSADANATLALNLNGGGYGAAVTNSLSIGGNTLVLPANTVAVRVVSQDLSQTNTYTVNVLLQPSATVPHLTNSVSGNNLVLAWPADHLGYRLLVQTGNLNKGVSGNINDWTTVAGSQSITSTNIAIIKAGVTNMYYKLVYP